ncbi:MAG: hypothetical protein R3A52_06135 [Polyangiales bacterium]
MRPDTRLDGDADDGPWEVIVLADPDDAGSTRGIRFRSAVLIEGDALASLNAQYKSRWPSMEQIKALVSRGFGRNRTRRRSSPRVAAPTSGPASDRTRTGLREALAALDAEPPSGEGLEDHRHGEEGPPARARGSTSSRPRRESTRV